MENNQPLKRRAGFTLLELLVVTAIIAVLIGLLIPAIQKARDASGRLNCLNNCKQMGLAELGYHDTYRVFTCALDYEPVKEGVRPTGVTNNWSLYLLPYLEQSALYEKYNRNALSYVSPGIETPNPELVQMPLKMFQCPASPSQGAVYNRDVKANILPNMPGGTYIGSASDYVPTGGVHRWKALVVPLPNEPELTLGGKRHGVLRAVSQEGAPKFSGKQTSIKDIVDGTSNTFLIGELSGRPSLYNAKHVVIADGNTRGAGWGDALNGMHWVDGTSPEGDQENGSVPLGPCLLNCSNVYSGGFFSFHTGGVNFVLADGSAKFFPDSTSNRVIAFMITYERGEVVPAD